jgi:hypothetical protein
MNVFKALATVSGLAIVFGIAGTAVGYGDWSSAF